jgi:hypothetical protein
MIILMTIAAKICLIYNVTQLGHIIQAMLGVILLAMIFNPVIFLIISLLVILCGKYEKLKMFVKAFQQDNNSLNDQIYLKRKSKNLNNKFSHTTVTLSPKNNTKKRKSSFSSASYPSQIRSYSAKNNPASGLPMAGLSSIDVRGNTYGTRRL